MNYYQLTILNLSNLSVAFLCIHIFPCSRQRAVTTWFAVPIGEGGRESPAERTTPSCTMVNPGQAKRATRPKLFEKYKMASGNFLVGHIGFS